MMLDIGVRKTGFWGFTALLRTLFQDKNYTPIVYKAWGAVVYLSQSWTRVGSIRGSDQFFRTFCNIGSSRARMVCASEIAIVLDGSCHGGGGSCPFSVKWGTGGKRGNGKGESGMEREREVEGRWKGAWEGKWSLYPLLQNPVYATSAGFTLQCLRKKRVVHMYCICFKFPEMCLSSIGKIR